MKVLWLTFIPSPYRLDFFEELARHCELTVLFESKGSKTRKSHWDCFVFKGYQGIIISGVSVLGYDRFCPSVIKYLHKGYDKIVIANPTSPTGIYAAAILRIKRIAYIVEGDGAFPSGCGGIKKLMKTFVMKQAQICFSTAKSHDQYYSECGVKPENIRRYPFTSLSGQDMEKQRQDKYALRDMLDMPESKIIVSVGRFSRHGYGKGFDLLMRLSAGMKDIGIYIIGDQPTAEFIRWKRKKGLDNVCFVGYKEKRELFSYYAVADLFVLLTRGDSWGLVINEAMACGLAVVTTDRCVAGLELVENGVNGYIVSPDDFEDIKNKIANIVNDDDLIQNMGRESLRKIQPYTIENMVKKHMEVFASL